MSIGLRKSFRRLQKHTYFDKIFSLFYYIKQVDNILPLSVQLLIHGTEGTFVCACVRRTMRGVRELRDFSQTQN